MANKPNVNPVAAGVVGAVVGTAVGVAAVKLSDKKTRQKVESKLVELKDKGEEAYGQLKKISAEFSGKPEDKKKTG